MTPLTSSLLRRTALTFERRERIRGIAGVLSMVPLSIFFALMAAFGEVLLCRIGCALLALSPAKAFYTIVRGRWLVPMPADCHAHECASHYRENLTRLRDLHRANRQLWLVVPGTVVGLAGWLIDTPSDWILIAGLAIYLGGFLYVCWDFSQREAARLQREIDLVDQA